MFNTSFGNHFHKTHWNVNKMFLCALGRVLSLLVNQNLYIRFCFQWLFAARFLFESSFFELFFMGDHEFFLRPYFFGSCPPWDFCAIEFWSVRIALDFGLLSYGILAVWISGSGFFNYRCLLGLLGAPSASSRVAALMLRMNYKFFHFAFSPHTLRFGYPLVNRIGATPSRFDPKVAPILHWEPTPSMKTNVRSVLN